MKETKIEPSRPFAPCHHPPSLFAISRLRTGSPTQHSGPTQWGNAVYHEVITPTLQRPIVLGTGVVPSPPPPCPAMPQHGQTAPPNRPTQASSMWARRLPEVRPGVPHAPSNPPPTPECAQATHTGTAVYCLDGLGGSSVVWTAVRLGNPMLRPSRAGEGRSPCGTHLWDPAFGVAQAETPALWPTEAPPPNGVLCPPSLPPPPPSLGVLHPPPPRDPPKRSNPVGA